MHTQERRTNGIRGGVADDESEPVVAGEGRWVWWLTELDELAEVIWGRTLLQRRPQALQSVLGPVGLREGEKGQRANDKNERDRQLTQSSTQQS